MAFPLYRTWLISSITAFSLFLQGCTCLTCDDGGEPSARVENWEDTQIFLPSTVIGLYSSPVELYAFTQNQFLRLDSSNLASPVERRNFLGLYQNLGLPAITEVMFARGIQRITTGEEAIEFQLVQNPGAVQRIPIDSLTSELIALEYDGSTVGAFNEEGTVYAQPVILRDKRTAGILIFDIQTDQTFTSFENIRFAGLIEMPDVSERQRVISSIKFLGDKFYIATKFGGYTLTTSGVLTEVIPSPTDIRDFFAYQGSIYATQVSFAPMFVSSDGGVSFESSGVSNNFRLVSTFDEALVTQELEGWMYSYTDDVLQQADTLNINQEFPRLNDKYFGLVELGDYFYLTVGSKIYRSKQLGRLE